MQKKTKNIIIGIVLIALLAVAVFLISNKTKQMPQNTSELAYSEYNTVIGGKEYGISTNVIQASSEIKPNISAGMIPIKKDGDYWIIMSSEDENWYDYSKGEPAYIMLNDGTYQSNLIKDMTETDKKLAKPNIGDQIKADGSIYVWIPRFEYNEENEELLYVKQECTVAGTWKLPSIFTCEIDNRNLSLAGIWVEYKPLESSSAVDTKVTELNKGEADNVYGFIGNTIATNANNEKDNVSEIVGKIGENIINRSSNKDRTILKIVDTNKREPLEGKAYYDETEGKMKIEVTYNTNEIDRIIDVVKGDIVSTNSLTAYANVDPENDIEWKYLIIDKIGNQKIIEVKNIFFIYNRETLVAFREAVNKGETTEEAKAYQVANVELNKDKYTKDEETGECTFNEDAEQWIPIGNADGVEFKGKYYGNGNTISGLYINNTDSKNQCMGLFGRVNGGEIYDLGIVDSAITSKSYYTSALIAKATNNIIVENCYNAGTIKGSGYTGGICGTTSNEATITNCYNTGNISGENRVYGIASGSKNVTNCYNTGEISGTNAVAGIGESNTTTNCYNTGKVSGANYIGGIYATEMAGYPIIKNCYNIGEITGTGDYVGGIFGNQYYYNTITNCYNAGKVSGTSYVGGISSYSCANKYKGKEYSTISNCYNTGEIIGTKDYVGGITGCLYSYYVTSLSYGSNNVYGCYNLGKINGANCVGGISGYSHSELNSSYSSNVGTAQNRIQKCYNNGDITGTVDNVGGICGQVYNQNISGSCTSNDYIQECYNAGTINGGNNHTGGICGQVYNRNTSTSGTINNYIQGCYNTGTIGGTEDYVGGICGYSNHYNTSDSGIINNYIQNCYNARMINGGNNYTGGICGYTSNFVSSSKAGTAYSTSTTEKIQNCYNIGEISGTNFVGGICGRLSASNSSSNKSYNMTYTYINYCYNIAKKISATSGNYSGAIYGLKNDTTTGIIVNTNISSDLSGTELDKEKMLETLGSEYMASTEYPVLKWQTDNDKLNLINGDEAFVQLEDGTVVLKWQVEQ